MIKSIAMQDHYYLEQLIRYIHCNPLRAVICNDVAQLDTYRWSGHSTLMGNGKHDFQETRQVLASIKL